MLTGVFPGENLVLHILHVGECEEAALWTARNLFGATGAEPSDADGVISSLTTDEPVNVGDCKDARVGEKFGHGAGDC